MWLGKSLQAIAAYGGKALGLLKGAGIAAMGAVGIGGAAAAYDVAANDGEVTGGIFEKFGGWWNKTINPLSTDLDNTEKILQEQAQSMSWFNSINGWFAGLFSFLGMDKMADFFKNRMEDTMKEVREHIDAQRDVLSGVDGDTPAGTNPASPAPTVVADPNDPISDRSDGEVTLGSAFAAAGYGLEKGLVSMGAGLASLGTGTWEWLTTDKGWGESLSEDFNQYNNWAMSGLEDLHGRPDPGSIDTRLEKALYYGGNFAGYAVPVAGTVKLVSAIPQAVSKFTPALGLAAGPR